MTTTQRMLDVLPEVIDQCRLDGNWRPAIGRQWRCDAPYCKYKDKACWVDEQNSQAGGNAQFHYFINPDIMKRWSDEIHEGQSSVEEPSTKIKNALISLKVKRTGSKASPKRDATSDGMAEMRETMMASLAMSSNLVTLITAQMAANMGVSSIQTPAQVARSAPSVQVTAVTPSSPVRSEVRDQRQLMRDFFDWFIRDENAGIEDAHTLQGIAFQLASDDWQVSDLRDPDRGGNIDSAYWSRIGGLPGTLVRIRKAFPRWKEYLQSQRTEAHDEDST
jgi:hypothetical protein